MAGPGQEPRSLERDDRGGVNDFILVAGKKVRSPIRQETVSIRGIVAGEYTVNVYHFAALTKQPVPVSVRVEKLNPTVQVVHYDTVDLDHGGQEETAVRFVLDENGAITDGQRERKSLLRTLRDPKRNGG